MVKAAEYELLHKLVEENLAALGLSLWGLEYRPAPGQSLVRVFVEGAGDEGAVDQGAGHEAGETVQEDESALNEDAASMARLLGGVDVESLSKASRQIGAALDVEDLVPGRYTLEVSTPGFDRVFFKAEQLPAYVGQRLKILIPPERSGPVPGRKNFEGALVSASGDVFDVDVEGTRFSFRFADVKTVKLQYDFGEPVKPKATKAAKAKAAESGGRGKTGARKKSGDESGESL